MRRDDPHRVGMFLPRALHEPDHWLSLAARVDLRRVEAITYAALVHKIGEVALRRGARTVAREVHVLRRADQRAPGACRDADTMPIAFAPRRIDDLGRPELAAAIGG